MLSWRRTIRDILQHPIIRIVAQVPLHNNLFLHIIFNKSCYFVDFKFVNLVLPAHICYSFIYLVYSAVL